MRVRLAAALAALIVLAVPQAASGWTWPVDGPVLRPFSFGSDPYAAGQHRGIDIGAPTGTPVLAAAGGTVTFAGTVPSGGKTVTILTSTGYAVTLVHLGSIRVLRGTTIEEGDNVGTVGPSGLPDIPEPYVYLGIRVAADDQGYLDPLLFLPPRAAPSASPPLASDPPSEGAGGEASAPPFAAEPPPTATPVPEPAADAGSETDAGSAPDADDAASPADGAATDAGTNQASTETGDESDATPESQPAGSPAPDAHPDADEQPAATTPVGEQQLEAGDATAPAASEPGADGAISDAPTAVEDEPAGGRAAAPLTTPRGAAFSARSSAGAAAPVSEGYEPSRTAIASRPSGVSVEQHAAPSSLTRTRRLHLAAVAPAPPSRAAGDLQRSSAATRGPGPVAASVTDEADRATQAMSLRAGASIGAATLAAALAAVLLLLRRRRRPGATPAGAEAPRMMVLVGGSGHAADPRAVDRQSRRLDLGTAAEDPYDRLAA